MLTPTERATAVNHNNCQNPTQIGKCSFVPRKVNNLMFGLLPTHPFLTNILISSVNPVPMSSFRSNKSDLAWKLYLGFEVSQ